MFARARAGSRRRSGGPGSGVRAGRERRRPPPTGGMDQAASLRASEETALLLDSASGESVSRTFVPEDLSLLVIDTRAPHRLADGQYAKRRAAVERATRRLGVASLRVLADRGREGADAVRSLKDDVLRRRVWHVISEIARVRLAVAAAESGDFAEFGRLLYASHMSLHRDFEVSCPELDTAVEAAMVAGALGARMTVAGSVVPRSHCSRREGRRRDRHRPPPGRGPRPARTGLRRRRRFGPRPAACSDAPSSRVLRTYRAFRGAPGAISAQNAGSRDPVDRETGIPSCRDRHARSSRGTERR